MGSLEVPTDSIRRAERFRLRSEGRGHVAGEDGGIQAMDAVAVQSSMHLAKEGLGGCFRGTLPKTTKRV